MQPAVKAALIVVGLIALWVVSGLIFPSSDEGEGQENARELDLASLLEIREMQSKPRQRHVVLYGETEPFRSVALKAETAGAVEAIPAREGQPLRKGEVILEIDERDRHEKLRQSEALVRQREIEYKAAVKLQAKGYQTEVRLAEAKTRLEDARAGLKAIRLDLEYTKLRAPFESVLESVNVEIGDFVGVGVFGAEGAIATVVDLDPIKVTGRISQFDLPYLARKSTVEIVLAGSKTHEGVIGYVGSVANEASRTFRIEVDIPNPDGTIPAGVAAELRIPLEAVPAYRLNSSALSLADDGQVGVKIVQADGTVTFTPVTVIEETREGIWVTGLPDVVRVITLGHTYVTNGQKVNLAEFDLTGEGDAPVVAEESE